MTRDLWWLALSLGFWGVGFGLYGVLWPLYVEQLGGGPDAIGLLATAAGVATAAVMLPGGWLTDRVDLRTLIFWGWVAGVPAPLLFAWAPDWHWLLVGVILYFGSAFSTPAVQALVVSEASWRALPRVYAIVFGMFGIGTVAGPTVGGLLAASVGFRSVFVVSGLCYLLATGLIWPIRPHPPAGRSPRFHWGPPRSPRLFRWTLLAAGLAAIQGLAGPFVVPYWNRTGHLPVTAIGLLGTIGAFAATVSGPVWGRLAERRGVVRPLGWATGLVAAGFLAILWNPASVGYGIFSALLRGLGEGARTLPGVALGRDIPRREAGWAYGWFNLTTELAGALAPLPGGVLFSRWAWAPLAIAAAAYAMLAWWLATAIRPPNPPIPP